MRIYYPDNVLTLAHRRIGWLLDEFGPRVSVSHSGGKDSTIILNIAIAEAEKRDLLPIPVVFVDQEFEWQMTVRHMQTLAADPRIRMIWVQSPFNLFSMNDRFEAWSRPWDPDREADWMHPIQPAAYTKNVYGTERFADLIAKSSRYHTRDGDAPTASITGLRVEESPMRMFGLTRGRAWKWASWGRDCYDGHYNMSPIYDWSTADVWKAIDEHGWQYNDWYDLAYRFRVPLNRMRVSALTHEGASYSLLQCHEMEPETWDRLIRRVGGVNVTKALDDVKMQVKLPKVFRNWTEYRDHLYHHYLTDEQKELFYKPLRAMEPDAITPELRDSLSRAQVTAIFKNDYHSEEMNKWRVVSRTKMKAAMRANPDYIVAPCTWPPPPLQDPTDPP